VGPQLDDPFLAAQLGLMADRREIVARYTAGLDADDGASTVRTIDDFLRTPSFLTSADAAKKKQQSVSMEALAGAARRGLTDVISSLKAGEVAPDQREERNEQEYDVENINPNKNRLSSQELRRDHHASQLLPALRNVGELAGLLRADYLPTKERNGGRRQGRRRKDGDGCEDQSRVRGLAFVSYGSDSGGERSDGTSSDSDASADPFSVVDIVARRIAGAGARQEPAAPSSSSAPLSPPPPIGGAEEEEEEEEQENEDEQEVDEEALARAVKKFARSAAQMKAEAVDKRVAADLEEQQNEAKEIDIRQSITFWYALSHHTNFNIR
jgi:hypothetical protein